MTLNIQIAVDCMNPHELADWWAETLDWAVEPQDEGFIRSMISRASPRRRRPCAHNGKLVWRDGAAIRPARGTRRQGTGPPRCCSRPSPEEKTIKNRVHWDVSLDGAGQG